MSGHRIATMYAFVAIEDDGDEGICAFSHNGLMLPMVGSDMRRVESLRPIAQNIADQTGRPIRLLQMTVREEIETLTPRGPA